MVWPISDRCKWAWLPSSASLPLLAAACSDIGVFDGPVSFSGCCCCPEGVAPSLVWVVCVLRRCWVWFCTPIVLHSWRLGHGSYFSAPVLGAFESAMFPLLLLHLASCWAAPRCAASCYTTLCYAMQCYATQCYATLCYATPCFSTQCFTSASPHDVPSHSVALCNTTLFRTQCFSGQFCASRCFTIQCFAALCYAVRFCTSPCSSLQHAAMLLRFVAFFNASSLAVVGLVLLARRRYYVSWVCVPFLFWTPLLVELASQCVGRRVSGAGTLAFLCCCFRPSVLV